ncbi:MAG: hypothetical protein NTZ17_19090 [Phycisphaerae bacterium]|nr:hypothetical protein [Phycisphaerae bacterium]
MIQQKIKEVQASVQKQAAGQPFAGPPEAVMQMYASLLDSLMQETQFVSLSLDPSATALRLASTVAAVPNTEMAKILGTDRSPQPGPNLLGYLDNGAAMNGVISLSPALLKTVTPKYMDFFTAMMGAAASKEDIAKLGQLMTDSIDALGGTIAWSFAANLKSKPPFEIKYVAALKDKQKFYQVLEQSSQMMREGTIADFYQKLGMKMRFDLKRNVETYQDVPIDSIHFTMQPADANTSNAPMQMQAQMMKTMFGEGFDLRLAIVNNLLLYTLAADPETKIHTLIDQVKAGGPTQIAGEVQAALSLLPDAQKAQVFGTYNILRLMQLGMAFAPIPVPPVDASRQSGIALCRRCRRRQAAGERGHPEAARAGTHADRHENATAKDAIETRAGGPETGPVMTTTVPSASITSAGCANAGRWEDGFSSGSSRVSTEQAWVENYSANYPSRSSLYCSTVISISRRMSLISGRASILPL